MDDKKFFGFGFGAIQSGLMICEAQRSGHFSDYLVAEVDQSLVDQVRANGSAVTINVAHADGVEKMNLEGIRVANPTSAEDRQIIAQGIRQADELATAVPSVNLYGVGGKASIAGLLAENLDESKPRLLYTAENNNRAAEILTQSIAERLRSKPPASFQALNTVIGKMSGIVQGISEIKKGDLAPLTPDSDRAVLVEEFNRILVSRVNLPGFQRGITVFEERDDLLPFEEAKLYGHNAAHAFLGYLAYEQAYEVMSELAGNAKLMERGRRALLEESGAGLIRKYRSVGDPLFTDDGFRHYADDLLERMVNPHLRDSVARICRDPIRKLGYQDRLVGALRLALSQGIRPTELASGVLAALRFVIEEGIDLGMELPVELDEMALETMLSWIWRNEKTDRYRKTCIDLIRRSLVGR